jgi:hypothetical protein
MSSIFETIKEVTGFGLDANKLYKLAFEKGVLLKEFDTAASYFNAAAKKFSEKGDQAMAARASANAKLYRYLSKTTTADSDNLAVLLEALSKLQHIEKIGSQTEMMPVQPLRMELECRSIEALMAQASGDVLRLRELHKLTRNRFQAMSGYPLITYEYKRSSDGHDEKAEERYHYHDGMYQFYEAMLKKDSDPAAAVDDLKLASRAFSICDDQVRLRRTTQLIENWRVKRTCWICGREMQGFELHFSMCHAEVTPYTKRLLESMGQSASAIDLEAMKIAVCTPCGSMISFKVAEEADKVRKELTTELDKALALIRNLERRLSQLEQRTNHS